jgi:hypothetical protein
MVSQSPLQLIKGNYKGTLKPQTSYIEGYILVKSVRHATTFFVVTASAAVGGTHHYSSRSHIATYGSRFLRALLSAVLRPARNQDSAYGVGLKTVSGGPTQLMSNR